MPRKHGIARARLPNMGEKIKERRMEREGETLRLWDYETLRHRDSRYLVAESGEVLVLRRGFFYTDKACAHGVMDSTSVFGTDSGGSNPSGRTKIEDGRLKIEDC